MPDPSSIDDYIAAFPKDVQSVLQKIRKIIRAEAPDAQEAIKYRMPTFVLNGNLVHFAAFEHHIGFYPTPSGIAMFASSPRPYKHSKGSVQFPLAQRSPATSSGRSCAFAWKRTAGSDHGRGLSA